MRKLFTFFAALSGLYLTSCGVVEEGTRHDSEADSWKFGMDLDFLQKNSDCIVIGEGESFVAISPKLQGRVMTSTLGGNTGYSLGWINRKLIEDKKPESFQNLYGGEDRFWIGPEGTDFSVFFQKDSIYIGENWHIPAGLSSEPWTLIARSDKQAKFEKDLSFSNIKGEAFSVKAQREISFISKDNAVKILGLEVPESVKCVAFQSLNKLTNTGSKAWTEESGLLTIASMSCFHANKSTYGFIPYNVGDKLGNIITDTYNETLGTDRLSIFPTYVRMRLDGTKVGEVNMNPKRSRAIMGSYDAHRNILTIITYIAPEKSKKYFPANWRRTNTLFDGDAVSLYNNGSPKEGVFDAERFYETATYSPALALEPNKSQIHVQRVFHFQGSEYELGAIAYKLLGVSMKQLRPE